MITVLNIFLRPFFFVFTFIVLGGTVQALPPVHRQVLPNETALLISEDHSLPFVTLQLLIDAGSGKDPAGEEGLARLTARGLLLGTARRSAKALNEELDYLGASLDAAAGRDYATVALRVMKKDLDKGLALLQEILTEPVFPAEEVQKEVDKTLAAIRAEEDQPEAVADKAFQENLYSQGPYKYPVEGTEKSLVRIKREALERFYRKYYRPGNSIMAVVGDVTSKEIQGRLISSLEKWKGEKAAPQSPPTVFAKGAKTVQIQRPLTQANIILGQSGVTRDNPDYYALTVMNFILGGGDFSSWLMQEIRIKRGLAYYVGSGFEPGKEPGSFKIALQTKNNSAKEAISLARQQMERIRKEKVSPRDLGGAQKYLVGSFPMRFDTQAKLANFLLQVEYYRLGLDYMEKYPRLIQAITGDEVLRVAQKYLHPENSLLVVVADLKAAGLE